MYNLKFKTVILLFLKVTQKKGSVVRLTFSDLKIGLTINKNRSLMRQKS